MIKFCQVTKTFLPDTKALDNVSFTIKQGEFVFLVGPSGAGKTTILRLLLRDIQPTEGAVIVNDEDIARIKESKIHLHRRRIGVAFQDFKLLYNRNVRENLLLSTRILPIPKAEADKEVDRVLQLVDLTDRETLFPVQLSGGEVQRLAIARALVNRPEILFADEPTGNLDPKNAWQIIALLRKINRQGKTVIMSSHNIDIVDSMRQRVIVLKNGRIVSDRKKGSYAGNTE